MLTYGRIQYKRHTVVQAWKYYCPWNKVKRLLYNVLQLLHRYWVPLLSLNHSERHLVIVLPCSLCCLLLKILSPRILLDFNSLLISRRVLRYNLDLLSRLIWQHFYRFWSNRCNSSITYLRIPPFFLNWLITTFPLSIFGLIFVILFQIALQV